MWNEWVSVIIVNNVLENRKTTSERSESSKNVIESFTVNRMIEAKVKQQIWKKSDKRDSRETSKTHCSNTARDYKISQSLSSKLSNENLLPANYFTDNTNREIKA